MQSVMLNPERVILNLVMNLFQHLIKSTSSETLKRVQGDRKILSQRSRNIERPQPNVVIQKSLSFGCHSGLDPESSILSWGFPPSRE